MLKPQRLSGLRHLTFTWLAGLALLAGCDQTPPHSGPTTTVTPTAASPTGPASPPETVADKSSDRDDSQAPAPVTQPSPEEAIALQRLQAYWLGRENEQVIEHRQLEPLPLPDWSRGSRFILTYASRGHLETCSACLPWLSFFEFRRGTGEAPPRLVRADIAVIQLGYRGQAPRPRLQMLGQHRYAITFFWASHGMGTYPRLTVLTRIKGRMRDVFDEAIGGFHDLYEGEGKEMSLVYWKSFHSFQPGRGPYPDLHVERHFLENQRWLRDARHGAFADEPSVNGQVPTRLVYRFDGRRYRRVIADQHPPRQHYECWKDSDDYDERMD